MDLSLTHTEENYLKALYKANQSQKSPVSTNAIAAVMKTSAASVTDMLKKLSSKELIIYEKYKGARLSPSGTRIATSIIRKHRLWETFLVDKLGFSWSEVHDIAEELEHIQSDKLVSRLDEFLDFPKFDPHGDPIPSADGKFTLREQRALVHVEEGKSGVLIGVKNHDQLFLDHLNELHLGLGSNITVIKKNAFDQSVVIISDEEIEVTLSNKISLNLLIGKIS